MKKERRKFTPEDRLSILQEGEREGRIETVRKYDLAPSLYDRWRKKYLKEGFSGLREKYKKIDPEIRSFEEENERLKRIIVRQALELEVKTELLKKTPIVTRKK